ncbi:thiamine phosphate synthase [Acetobacter suratthaniensis]|uniref:Thiamine phosphate synthase n=1 Tax=Acetobacter suratthaniensis TaxID=1502841 RepID=A0ABS3LKJ7_9PROT|nr:thiamine phosphate synthase [Acetobacter suratthaniensis]
MSELYLATPVLEQAEPFLSDLQKRLAACQPAALLLRLPPVAQMSDHAAAPLVAAVAACVQPMGIALMVQNRAALAVAQACDGVHLCGDAALDTASVRRMVGEAMQLGVDVGLSRDHAMRAGEEGADYICFTPGDESAQATPESVAGALELTRWWAVMMELPVVAQAMTAAEVAPLAAAGADFIMPGQGWWDSPQGWNL